MSRKQEIKDRLECIYAELEELQEIVGDLTDENFDRRAWSRERIRTAVIELRHALNDHEIHGVF